MYTSNRCRDTGNNNIHTYTHFAPEQDKSILQGWWKIYRLKASNQRRTHFTDYYVKNIYFIEIVRKKDTVIKKTNEKEALKQDDEANESIASWCNNLKKEQKCRTWKFNEQLTEDAHNVELWLQYIDF